MTPALGPLARLAVELGSLDDNERALDASFAWLSRELGLEHVALYAVASGAGTLYAVASSGFEPSGVGAEVAVGAGPVGVVAKTGVAVRFSDLAMELRYARTVREASARSGATLTREIPLPGLADARSLVAVPLRANGVVVGVLAAESRERGAFGAEHEDALTLVAALLAPRLVEEEESEEQGRAPARTSDGRVVRARLYAEDDSVFLDDVYVVKGVPGRILKRLLTAHRASGRVSFTNKELRLDASLGLPALKDNLESRLILLRRRLAEKDCGVRLERPARGRLELVVEGELRIEEL